MNIIELNKKIEDFINKNQLSGDALALKQEHSIAKAEEWQQVLDNFADEGRVLRIGIIGRVKAGKSSMLNALLFHGNDILPKAATPMTAALTIMQYSETVRAEVDFFTQKDIDEIKIKHDLYLQLLTQKENSNFEEQKRRAGRRKKDDHQLSLAQLNAEEIEECRTKARAQAEREMKNHASYASYDQYSRIRASGKSLADLEAFRTIQAASVEELMNGALMDFVGSSGKFMPFTKAVTLHIPEPGLKGLQIIDTPGINDPVTSRGERTEELLQHCDVVLIVSPAGQFLSDEDTNLLHRITTKEGTQQAYIIASKVDDQLFGSERIGLNNPTDVLEKISKKLTAYARDVLQNQVRQFPEMKVAADKLSHHNVVYSSGVAYALQQRFDCQDTWDSLLRHVWDNLNRTYPDTFGQPDLAKNALANLANIEKLHSIIQEVTDDKEQILASRQQDFENSKRQALQGYLKAWEHRLNGQVAQIKTTDVGELKKQEKLLKSRHSQIEMSIGGVYDDLIADIKLNLDKQLKDELAAEIRKFDASAESAQGTVSESYQVYVGRGGFLWLTKEYETRHREINTVQATPLRRAIEDVRDNLEDKLRYLAESYSQSWKKKIYAQIVGALRETMGDDDLDKGMITRAVKNVLARIPEASFQLQNDLPESLHKSGQLRGSEADEFMAASENYVFDLRHSIRNEIDSHMRRLVDNLKSVNLPQELSGDLESNLSQLLHEIENKEASLFHYEHILKELESLKNEARI